MSALTQQDKEEPVVVSADRMHLARQLGLTPFSLGGAERPRNVVWHRSWVKNLQPSSGVCFWWLFGNMSRCIQSVEAYKCSYLSTDFRSVTFVPGMFTAWFQWRHSFLCRIWSTHFTGLSGRVWPSDASQCRKGWEDNKDQHPTWYGSVWNKATT